MGSISRWLGSVIVVAVLACFFLIASLDGFAKTTQNELASTFRAIIPNCTKTQMLIPLYSYPNWYDSANYIWDDVVTATDQISITTIINPNNGPESCPLNSDYQHGIDDLRSGGVTILGYVYTSYGLRPTEAITAEIDLYDQCFNIDGIFLDEGAITADKCDYYRQLCDYVKSSSNLDRVFINPGTTPDECYLSQTNCDTFVVFEGYSSDWPPYIPPSYISDYPSERFAAIVHSVPDTDTMKGNIDLAIARNISYVYMTDDILSNPYDILPLFWQAEVDYIESVNVCKAWLPIILH